MNILVINCGSSSVKYQVIDPAKDEPRVAATIERIGQAGKDHAAALDEVLAATDALILDAVGHRVVHGGSRFRDACLIDDRVVGAIEACTALAPLHNPANLAGIRAARRAWPGVPHVAVFDTALHARLPRRAHTYALAPALADELGARRYGFHGTSHAYVAGLAADHLGRPLNELRLVSLHLGNGASACALEFGHSVETSMGMTPLEGLVMGTRSGDLDPGAVLALARARGIGEAERILNRESGLAGLSGHGNDLRDVEAAAAGGDDSARLAIAVFAHRARKYIGAYAAVMGGLDAVLLTGGIGQNSATMRRRVLQRLTFLGLSIDEDKNADARITRHDPVADVSADPSRVRALVIRTDEARQIALATAAIALGAAEVRRAGPIPLAISARHVHLDRKTMDVLFGSGSEMSVFRPLIQPGQFAADQEVALVGPRGRIEGVRVLGPLRRATQVEISRTDEFRLGVDAPIRRSGQLSGSAPITLVGPAGTLHLEEGLICARRHIHMTPTDADAYGVADGDEVEIRIDGGPRDLTFGDVLIRVRDSFQLEMHIDTDEANAAELSRGASGDLVYSSPAGAATAQLRLKRPQMSQGAESAPEGAGASAGYNAP